jgi:hypothetical protein
MNENETKYTLQKNQKKKFQNLYLAFTEKFIKKAQ